MAGINLDQFSFWIGFLAATLSWGFIAFLRPTFIRVYNRLKSRSQKLRQEMMAGIDVRLNNDTLKLIQKSHLADRLFALDEILITPRLLAPRPQILPDKSPILEDTITNLLPYTPDWPEMAMLYGAPTITLAEALQETPRLIVMGRPGSGKTVTLAQLVAQIIRKEQLPGDLNERSPLWVNVGDLNLPTKNPENLLETLYDATSPYTSTLILPRLLSHIEDLFRNHRALLIMDGLDELPPENIDEVVEFISDILREFPDIPIVTTASMEYYGRLTELDFAPVALANWDNNQRAEFIRKWSEQWEKFVGSLSTNFEGTDPLLLNAWLFQDQSSLSPLELTLKVWAAYAGDTLGSKSIHSLESYVRRMTVDIPHGRDALEKIAHGIIRTYKPIFTIQEAEEWLSGTLQNSFKDEVEKESEDQDLPSSSSSTQMRTKLVSSRVLPSLQANGLINKRQDGRLQIVHSQILSYVGGITKINNGQDLFFIEKPKWTSAVEALGYHAININSESLITNFLQADSAPLYRSIFQAAFWLRFTDPKTSWRVNVVKKLVDIIRDARAPLGLRIRSSTALATSGVQGIETLFQTLLSSQDSQLRMIAVLGSGLIGNPVLVENLAKLINDQEIHVRKAAIFALVAIGSQAALEEIADILL
ncbi:MAG: NACHT domain-containing protein, partial [Anaerolineales bacterium]